MVRLLVPVFIAGFLFLAGYYLFQGLKALNKVEFVYVRFRDGVLVLKRKGRFGEEEISFKPHALADTSQPKLLAANAGSVEWFSYPDGHPISANSEEGQAIVRCLRFAENTGLLQAELVTE